MRWWWFGPFVEEGELARELEVMAAAAIGDVEHFLAPLRDRARANAGSAVYRGFAVPELVRIMRGAYRSTRLTTPTRVLFGADDPTLRPEFISGHEPYVDDLQVEFVDGASHWIADERPDVVLDRATGVFAAR
jgi:pimeloyl-ACP methyl ester carboxylesterase